MFQNRVLKEKREAWSASDFLKWKKGKTQLEHFPPQKMSASLEDPGYTGRHEMFLKVAGGEEQRRRGPQ